MINPKRVIEMAMRRINGGESTKHGSNSVAHKGNFVVYTIDSKRFVIPLECLSSSIFRELLRMSEEEFGFPSNRPITLPCDSIFMEFLVSLIRGCLSIDKEYAFLLSVSTGRCSSSAFSLSKDHGPSTDTFSWFLREENIQ
ncbi:hypothetical protein NE237_023700 [Protea cynaroides]|uniref:Small auxin up regulated protein n=1 Tax=Protea cynaroides TaxID=273540 RepID=A0A9Q0HEH8_9MAGN|nr:hypothetical protein NE237_023700 [Protea cynaroides]